MSNIVIYGNGKTGQSLAKYVRQQGDNVYLYDDNPQRSTVSLEQIPLDAIDKILVSPGVPPTGKLLQIANDRGIEVEGELQYCFDRLRAPCISVTGTNGKTTVTEMIHCILKGAGLSSQLLGNGGVPLSSRLAYLTGKDVVVLESSSFQLMYATDYFPKISLITNLAPDHINYHGTYNNYKAAKQKNCCFQRSNQYAIFNLDDGECCTLAQHINAAKYYYSVCNKNAHCYFEGGKVVFKGKEGIVEAQCNGLDKLPQAFASDAIAAILTCALYGVELDKCVSLLQHFQPDDHRMQAVANFGGVQFVDDSKATNVHAALSAIRSLGDNVVIILGGSDKGEQYDMLFAKQLKGAVVLGATSKQLLAAAERQHFEHIERAYDMQHAVSCAYNMCKGGGYVLLSPACASFDSYSSYAERGKDFVKAVKQLESITQS